MKVFESASIRTLNLKNRIIRSATGESMCDENGFPTGELTDLYVRLAKGEPGAIVTGAVAVQPNGRFTLRQPMLPRVEYIRPYQAMNARLREYGVPMILQLVHAGVSTFLEAASGEAVGPAAYRRPLGLQPARALSDEEVGALVDSFVEAIVRAKEAGFQGVQLHAAHGYLLHQFLSPRMNRRVPPWGGSVENRFRIVREIMQKARERVGAFPILVKYSAYDYEKNGISLEEGLRIAELMQKASVDAIEVSCGGMLSGPSVSRTTRFPIDAMMEYTPQLKSLPGLKRFMLRVLLKVTHKEYPPLHNYNTYAAEKVKSTVDIPVIVVGGIRRLSDIEDIINNNRADFVSMCRPFIIDPNVVRKMKTGEQTESRCIDCGYCIWGLSTNSLRCYYGKLRQSCTPE